MHKRAGMKMDSEAGLLGDQVGLHDARRFRSIFKCNVLPLVFWRPDGQIRDANDAYLELTGYSRQELYEGRLRWDHLTPAEHSARDARAIKELRSGKAICTPFQKDYIRHDGTRVPVLVGGALLPNRQDEGIAFALDLTKYSSPKNALHARRHLIQSLFASCVGPKQVPDIEKLASLKGDKMSFSEAPESGALLAHELSQPLGTILADAQSARRLLRQRAPDLEELKAIVADIITEDRRASQLIDRIRLLAKRHMGVSQLLNVNQLVSEVIHMLRNEFSAAGVRIDLELAPDLPPIRGDRVQLHQVLVNLLSNACEALNQIATSFKTILVRTYLERQTFVSIEVHDTGPGVPSEQLEAIFEPFVSSKKGGMGIGLYICRSIIKSHGGRLWATNDVGGGATFQVRLPAISGR
jgi:PAS domain S-box-containing protein